ncbi:MAG: hypothetical protein H0X24_17455 [Ktedonobacterales bacterium]|nr:hypothetical protein [Ktedonobacterales bacterium]
MNLFEKHALLNQLFQQSPVEAAYLSGTLASRASFGEMSDVDIAILLANQIATDQFLDYQFYFLSELTKRLEAETVDVVILNQASMLLKLQVIKYGQILYSRDEKKRAAFEAGAVLQYLDFRQMDDLQNGALARRLRTPTLALDRDGLRAALGRLRTAVATISVGLPTAEAFTEDVRAQVVAERGLLLAIEAMAHLATLLYAGLGIRQPEGYDEVLRPLAVRELVPRDVVARLEPLVRQRDVLLRTPEVLSRAELHQLALASAPDIAALGVAIADYLGEPASDTA